jgi:lysozyme family protein
LNSNFPNCLKFVLQDEGGDSENPNDSGGRTSRGITQREYTAWCHLHKSPDGDVFVASDATIQAIYQQQYWLPNCDPMPKGTDYILFDMNVNMGQVQANKLLQRYLKVAADGHIGVVTMDAALKADPKLLIPAVSKEKIAFYKELEREQPKDVVFDKGWMNRVANVQSRAMGML